MLYRGALISGALISGALISGALIRGALISGVTTGYLIRDQQDHDACTLTGINKTMMHARTTMHVPGINRTMMHAPYQGSTRQGCMQPYQGTTGP